MPAHRPEVERFWSKVDKAGPCWLWTGSTVVTGKPKYPLIYGRFHLAFSGRAVRAHRWSWEAEHGPIPAGLCVLHSCDVPLCVRPSHLFLGTRADNMADMRAKGRSRGAPRGAAHPRARLTQLDVDAMRAAAAVGQSVRALARQYGVASSTAHRAVHGVAWRTNDEA